MKKTRKHAPTSLTWVEGGGCRGAYEVEAKTGFKRAHIYNLMKAGKFPKALRLGVRAVGWDAAEIDQWIEDRLNERT